MKRIVLLLVLAVCLTGCYGITDPPDTTVLPPATATEAQETAAPTQETTQPQTLPPLQQPEPEDTDFVRIRDYIPEIQIQLAYATQDNFTGQRIYAFSEPWLRYGTVKKLMAVQAELSAQGLGLKIWDGFRPTAAQFKLWDVYPDPNYVSNPNKGFSSHSRGNTVDITLVKTDGTELIMPTGFDDFSKLADRDYSDCSPKAAENALLLENTMKKHGFKPYSGEWWHFTDREAYEVEKVFQPVERACYTADCKEFISLRTAADTAAEVMAKIPAGESMWMLALHGEFALVECRGAQGYVLRSYIQPAQ